MLLLLHKQHTTLYCEAGERAGNFEVDLICVKPFTLWDLVDRDCPQLVMTQQDSTWLKILSKSGNKGYVVCPHHVHGGEKKSKCCTNIHFLFFICGSCSELPSSAYIDVRIFLNWNSASSRCFTGSLLLNDQAAAENCIALLSSC